MTPRLSDDDRALVEGLVRDLPAAPPDAQFARRVRHLAALTPQQPALAGAAWWRWGWWESGGLAAGTSAGAALALMVALHYGVWWPSPAITSDEPEAAGISLAQVIAPPPHWSVVRVDAPKDGQP